MVRRVPRLAIALTTATFWLLLAAQGALGMTEKPAPPAAAPTPPTMLSGRNLIVQWTPGADASDRADARADAEVISKAVLGSPDFQLVRTMPSQAPGAAVRELEADPAVALAERDSYSAPSTVPDDPLFGELWGLRNQGLGINGFAGAVAGDDIDALGAWDRTVGDPATVVADIDSGYRFEHPDLADVAWTNPGEIAGNGLDDDGDGIVDDVHGADFVGPNAEATPVIDGDPTDDDLLSGGHGVHTAGTIGAAGDNGVGITGVAEDVRIMPLRVCAHFPSLGDSRCPISSQVAAINYAGEEGARVANMSLGSTDFSQAQVNAIAANPDVLFVVSAGNDGEDNDSIPHYPCDYRPQQDAFPPVPGAIDNVVCVAATNQADGLAGFSDWGAESVDLGAPGTETLSTYPYSAPLEEDFEAGDFATAWPASGGKEGFERTDEAPLTSFGMTDSIGPAVANTVRETTSAAVALPANGGCKLSQTRRVVLGGGDLRYSVLLDGGERAGAEPASTQGPGLERRFLELPAAFEAGGSLQVRFRFAAGPAPTATSGVWVDDLDLVCAEAVGQASGYGFLEGTSMAAPHVSGAAGLLFSWRPAASVTEVREALLGGVDQVPSLSAKTTSGGRLDVSAALDAIEAPPPAPQLTATDPASPAASAGARIIGSAESGSTVEIYSGSGCGGPPVAEGTAAELASPGILVSVAPGSAEFSARAFDPALNASPCSNPIGFTNSTLPIQLPPDVIVTPPGGSSPPPPAAPCTVPKLAGRTLAQAKASLIAAACRLGKVHKPKRRRGHRLPALVVKASSPMAGAADASGVVALTLGPRPTKHRH